MAFGDADASTPAFASVNSNWTTVGATSGLFTPPAGSLVVLFVMADTSSGANPGNETVTDTIDGATGWTFKIRRAKPDSGSQAGTVAWWEKVYSSAPVAPIAVTVVGNATGASAGGFQAYVVASCASSEGHAEGSNTAAAVSLSVTSSTDNARCMVAVTDWNVQANMTAGTAQTAYLASSVGSGPDTRVYVGIRDAATSPAGSVTMSTASPTSGNANNFIGAFLVPAAGVTNLNAGNVATAVAANSATLAVSTSAGNAASTVAANSATLAVATSAGNAALAIAANDATLTVSVATGFGAVGVGANDATLTVGTALDAGNAAAAITASNASLQVSTAAGFAACDVVANNATLAVSSPAGFAAISIGAFDASLSVSGVTTLSPTGAMIGVGAFDATISGTVVVTVPGSWQGLKAILDEIRQVYAEERTAPPVACPLCGEPLYSARGSLRCRYDGWSTTDLTL